MTTAGPNVVELRRRRDVARAAIDREYLPMIAELQQQEDALLYAPRDGRATDDEIRRYRDLGARRACLERRRVELHDEAARTAGAWHRARLLDRAEATGRKLGDCQRCDGTGTYAHFGPCFGCGGSGWSRFGR